MLRRLLSEESGVRVESRREICSSPSDSSIAALLGALRGKFISLGGSG